MIRLIITIETRNDEVFTRLETDGIMLARASEIKQCELIRNALREVCGEVTKMVTYTKDLPPISGRKQQT